MILEAQNISKEYRRTKSSKNSFEAVKALNFELHENEFVEIIGRSGSGKSTILSMLSGILTPSSGSVLFYMNGTQYDLFSLSDPDLSEIRNKYFGIIPQGQSGLSGLTVYENVLLPAMLKDKPNQETEERATMLLEQMGIGYLKDAYPNELSGGELRRMAIARALINSPRVLFADEPTNDLDDETSEQILQVLKDISRKTASVILVTHETEAQKYAGRLLKMDNGFLKESNEVN